MTAFIKENDCACVGLSCVLKYQCYRYMAMITKKQKAAKDYVASCYNPKTHVCPNFIIYKEEVNHE